jgi:hypothetical protein
VGSDRRAELGSGHGRRTVNGGQRLHGAFPPLRAKSPAVAQVTSAPLSRINFIRYSYWMPVARMAPSITLYLILASQ